MTIKELINYGKKMLNENEIEDAYTISKVLAQYILNMDRVQIISNDEKIVDEDTKNRYYLALIEIVQGMPIQYITNNQEFMKMNFYVDENVLVPQPDTEILVQEVIDIVKKENKKDILDMCTGSGCIGISVGKNLENVNVTLADISSKALEIAKINSKNNDVKNINYIETNMFENICEKYDIIVSNPPYIETNEMEKLPKNVKKEPHIALDGGEDGLDFYKILVQDSKKHLKRDGYLCMEIGYDQKQRIEELIQKDGSYENIYSKKDLGGNDRIVICKIK